MTIPLREQLLPEEMQTLRVREIERKLARLEAAKQAIDEAEYARHPAGRPEPGIMQGESFRRALDSQWLRRSMESDVAALGPSTLGPGVGRIAPPSPGYVPRAASSVQPSTIEAMLLRK